AHNGALNPWGTLVVSVAGTSQQATFQVADPHLVYSLTTDQSVYQLGEPVQISFTETNTGDQPVTISPNLLSFNITQDATWIWSDYSPWCGDPTTVTLQPGESFTVTATWDGSSYDGTLNPSGTFVVSVAGTSQQATFQVDGSSAQPPPAIDLEPAPVPISIDPEPSPEPVSLNPELTSVSALVPTRSVVPVSELGLGRSTPSVPTPLPVLSAATSTSPTDHVVDDSAHSGLGLGTTQNARETTNTRRPRRHLGEHTVLGGPSQAWSSMRS